MAGPDDTPETGQVLASHDNWSDECAADGAVPLFAFANTYSRYQGWLRFMHIYICTSHYLRDSLAVGKACQKGTVSQVYIYHLA